MAELEPFDQFALGVGRESWAVFRRDPVMFIVAAVVMMFGSCLSLGLLAGPLHVGFIELVREARRGQPIALGVLFSRFDSLIASLVALVLIGVATLIGFFLLVLPGIAVLVFAAFTLHAITYENLSGIDAIRRSVQLVRDNLTHAVTLFVAIAIVQGLGSAVVFGVLLTAPLSFIGLTIGYERIGACLPRLCSSESAD